MIVKTPYIFKVLKIARDVREIVPGAHIGGSVGLFLHGLVLDRPWHDGPFDLDITIEKELSDQQFARLSELYLFDGTKGDSADMDLKFVDEVTKIKVEMQVDDESRFVVVPYKGCEYLVKDVNAILRWKEHYANAYDDQKHINDLKLLVDGWAPSLIEF